jgi:ADP-ribose pyrophosphatase YjhB (NUDIX family)
VSAIIVDKDRARVLLTRRAVEPFSGQWDVPGGFVQIGESIEDGLRRELREELQIEVHVEHFLGSYPDTYGEDATPVIAVFYVVAIERGSPVARDDVSDCRWFRREEIPVVAFENGRRAIEEWRRQMTELPTPNSRDVLRDCLGQLRQEIVSFQNLRLRAYLYKIAAFGILFSAAGVSLKERPRLATAALVLAPFLAVCLDATIQGMSVTIKEIGYYIRTQMEPLLVGKSQLVRDLGPAAETFQPYEKWLHASGSRAWGGRFFHFAPTVLASFVAALGLAPFPASFGVDVALPALPVVRLGPGIQEWGYFIVWLILVCVFLLIDCLVFRTPRKFRERTEA